MLDPRAPRRFEVELVFRAQTYDIDFAGIVSNIVYIRWLEDLRLKLLDEYWPLQDQMAAGYAPVLLSTDIRYLRALRLFASVAGTMWMSHLGRARFTLEAEFTAGDETVAAATQVGALVNLDSLRPIRIPSSLAVAYGEQV
ncbi:MAG TPA: thioesterase family protein [Chloroflexota bacterium]|nr:thioesterase family protein [Chloroflexota bacterium]